MIIFKKRPVVVTIRTEFCYGHCLRDYVGKCANAHGHNAILEVSVTGAELPEFTNTKEPGMVFTNTEVPGMVVDFNILKNYIRNHITDILDHKFLNDVPYFHNNNPTAENMLLFILGVLTDDTSPFKGRVYRVKLSETTNSWVEWEAPETEIWG